MPQGICETRGKGGDLQIGEGRFLLITAELQTAEAGDLPLSLLSTAPEPAGRGQRSRGKAQQFRLLRRAEEFRIGITAPVISSPGQLHPTLFLLLAILFHEPFLPLLAGLFCYYYIYIRWFWQGSPGFLKNK